MFFRKFKEKYNGKKIKKYILSLNLIFSFFNFFLFHIFIFLVVLFWPFNSHWKSRPSPSQWYGLKNWAGSQSRPNWKTFFFLNNNCLFDVFPVRQSWGSDLCNESNWSFFVSSPAKSQFQEELQFLILQNQNLENGSSAAGLHRRSLGAVCSQGPWSHHLHGCWKRRYRLGHQQRLDHSSWLRRRRFLRYFLFIYLFRNIFELGIALQEFILEIVFGSQIASIFNIFRKNV